MPAASLDDRSVAIEWAKNTLQSPSLVILDTETTGLSNHDEIVSIGVIDGQGTVLLDHLIKPTRVIPLAATNIHGISNIDVDDAPRLPELYPEIARVLNGKVVVGYNIDYDLGMLRANCKKYRLPLIRPMIDYCAMKKYAQFNGARNDLTGDYKWFRLSVACAQLGIPASRTHAAVDDCQLTLALLHGMASAQRTPI